MVSSATSEGDENVVIPRRRQTQIPKLVAAAVILAAMALVSCSGGESPFVPVPNMEGQSIEDATEELQVLILEWSVRCRDSGPEGVVLAQYPEPGTVVSVGTTIHLHQRCS